MSKLSKMFEILFMLMICIHLFNDANNIYTLFILIVLAFLTMVFTILEQVISSKKVNKNDF
jgi:hypothetical protein